jgi:hypothetical protein
VGREEGVPDLPLIPGAAAADAPGGVNMDNG